MAKKAGLPNGKFNAHQGDVQIFSVDSIPSNAKQVSKTFFAASEKSGHVHALCGDYEMFTAEVDNNTTATYIRVGNDGAVLNHTPQSHVNEKYWDKKQVTPQADHKPTTLTVGDYLVDIQRRVDPFEATWKQVRD